MTFSPSGQLARAFLLVLTAVILWTDATNPWPVCRTIPSDKEQLQPIVEIIKGNVGVIQLLHSSITRAIEEVSVLDTIKIQLSSQGLNDVQFLGLSSKQRHARLTFDRLRKLAGFPNLHSTHRNHFFHELGGRHGDVLVFDRCGRLTYQIGQHDSPERRAFVEAAIWSTYSDNPCGVCGSGQPAQNLESNTNQESNSDTNFQCRCAGEGLRKTCACSTEVKSCMCLHSSEDFEKSCDRVCHDSVRVLDKCYCKLSNQLMNSSCVCIDKQCQKQTDDQESNVNGEDQPYVDIRVVAGSDSSLFERFKSYMYDRFIGWYNYFSGKEQEVETRRQSESNLS